jgi:hypothetical protein
LLFLVQPVISKMILPWFGGSPAVWTTCLLFFQTLLLCGYAYADVLRRLRPARQAVIHVTLIAAALAMLPITPGAAWKPLDGNHPLPRILLLLLAHVGLPYFVLSSTGPLIQSWFSHRYAGRSPYRLYALSNVGSLAALLTYPFLFEPRLAVQNQAGLWSAMFGVFAVLCGVLAVAMWRVAANVPLGAETVKANVRDDDTLARPSRNVAVSLRDTAPSCGATRPQNCVAKTLPGAINSETNPEYQNSAR